MCWYKELVLVVDQYACSEHESMWCQYRWVHLMCCDSMCVCPVVVPKIMCISANNSLVFVTWGRSSHIKRERDLSETSTHTAAVCSRCYALLWAQWLNDENIWLVFRPPQIPFPAVTVLHNPDRFILSFFPYKIQQCHWHHIVASLLTY